MATASRAKARIPGRPRPGRAVADEDAPVCGVLRMECQTEEPTLVEGRGERHERGREIEEGLGEHGAAGVDHPDQTRLEHDEAAAGSVPGVRQEDGRR